MNSWFEKEMIDYTSKYLHDIYITFRFENPNDDDYTFDNYLSHLGNVLTSHERKMIFNVYNNCKCCLRHQEKRPNIKQYELGFSGNYEIDDTDDSNNNTDIESDSDVEIQNVFCTCDCRHNCRILCQVQNIMNEVKTEFK